MELSVACPAFSNSGVVLTVAWYFVDLKRKLTFSLHLRYLSVSFVSSEFTFALCRIFWTLLNTYKMIFEYCKILSDDHFVINQVIGIFNFKIIRNDAHNIYRIWIIWVLFLESMSPNLDHTLICGWDCLTYATA